MSSNLRLLSIAVLSLALSGFAAAVSAQEAAAPQKEGVDKQQKFERRGRMKGEGFRGMRRGHGGMLRGLHGITLTDAQKAQIKAIHEANKPDQATMEQLKALREARRSGTALTDAQKEQLKSIRQAQRDKMKLVHEQVLNVLTAEQRQQLEQRKQEMKQRMQERRQMRQQRREQKQGAPVVKPTEG